VLSQHRDWILRSVDDDSVFLNHLLDHLMTKGYIQSDQVRFIKSEPVPQSRIGILLDLVLSEGNQAFNEFCKAVEVFGTCDKRALAGSLQRSLTENMNDAGNKCEYCSNVADCQRL